MGMDYETYVNYVHQLRPKFRVWYTYKDISKRGPEGKGYSFQFPTTPKESSPAANVILAYHDPAVSREELKLLYPGLHAVSKGWDGRTPGLAEETGYASFSSEKLRKQFAEEIKEFKIFLEDTFEISFIQFQLLLWQPLIQREWVQTEHERLTLFWGQHGIFEDELLESLNESTPGQLLSWIWCFTTKQLEKLQQAGKENIRALSTTQTQNHKKVTGDFQSRTDTLDRRLEITYYTENQLTNESTPKITIYSLNRNNPVTDANDILAVIFCIYKPTWTQQSLEDTQNFELQGLKLLPSSELEAWLNIKQVIIDTAPTLNAVQRYRNKENAIQLKLKTYRLKFSDAIKKTCRITYKVTEAENTTTRDITFETLETLIKCFYYIKVLDTRDAFLDQLINAIENKGSDVLARFRQNNDLAWPHTFFNDTNGFITVPYPSMELRKAVVEEGDTEEKEQAAAVAVSGTAQTTLPFTDASHMMPVTQYDHYRKIRPKQQPEGTYLTPVTKGKSNRNKRMKR